jgi:hypothetical protein
MTSFPYKRAYTGKTALFKVSEKMAHQGKRNAVESIEEIFRALPLDGTVSAAQLAVRLGSTWGVANKYLTLIWRIQHGPRVIAMREEGTQNVNWRRDYGSLPDEVKA